jgi:amino-acid N-acetyltransferase
MRFDAEVAALLVGCGLAVDDAAESRVALLGCRRGGRLAGVVGLEIYGHSGLLRSLAVAPSERGAGLGHALVERAEQRAARRGVRDLYLLTTSAAEFFARLGYVATARSGAPASIAATRQFAGLCPAAATFMTKMLPPPLPAKRRTLSTSVPGRPRIPH